MNIKSKAVKKSAQKKSEFKSPCAPKIWRKFDEDEKGFWTWLYLEFVSEHLYPPSIKDDWIRIIAHNMATILTWEWQKIKVKYPKELKEIHKLINKQ